MTQVASPGEVLETNKALQDNINTTEQHTNKLNQTLQADMDMTELSVTDRSAAKTLAPPVPICLTHTARSPHLTHPP